MKDTTYLLKEKIQWEDICNSKHLWAKCKDSWVHKKKTLLQLKLHTDFNVWYSDSGWLQHLNITNRSFEWPLNREIMELNNNMS